jgi:hypothetical protein
MTCDLLNPAELARALVVLSRQGGPGHARRPG